MVITFGCTEDEGALPPKAAQQFNNNWNSQFPIGSQDPCGVTVPPTNNMQTNPATPGTNNFGQSQIFLQAMVVTYATDLKVIIDRVCLACHNGSDASKPNFTMWAGVSSYRRQIVSEVRSGHGGRLTALQSGEQQKFDAWEQGGYLQGSTSGTTTGSATPAVNPGFNTGTALPNCNVSVGSTVPGTTTTQPGIVVPDLRTVLINPPELQQCHNQSLMYDRNAKACDTASLDMTWCQKAGIVSKFGAKGPLVSTALDTAAADGYQIDQCGMRGTVALVTLYKYVEGTSTQGDASLQIRRIASE